MHFVHQQPPATPTLTKPIWMFQCHPCHPKINMTRSVMKTEDNQQSQPQVPKQEAMEQDVQANPVQSSSVVGEDT
eukprot:9636942-Ditylum_brightwellii.AAC.1